MPKLYAAIMRDHKPQNWKYSNRNGELKVVSLHSSSRKFIKVEQLINRDLDVTVDAVERIENPFLWSSYQLMKEEYSARRLPVREEQLFHCTASASIPSIIKNNLDWQRFQRTKFGRGVSFSSSAEYADRYANCNIGPDRALIVAKVLVGHKCGGRQNMIIPPAGYDTTTGNGNKVTVKYCDYEFYPEYVAYYTDSSSDEYSEDDNYYY